MFHNIKMTVKLCYGCGNSKDVERFDLTNDLYESFAFGTTQS